MIDAVGGGDGCVTLISANRHSFPHCNHFGRADLCKVLLRRTTSSSPLPPSQGPEGVHASCICIVVKESCVNSLTTS